MAPTPDAYWLALRRAHGVGPRISRLLLERFVQKVPGPAHRAALEACALARVTTEALLAQMLTQAGASTLPSDPMSPQGTHELFEWLRGLWKGPFLLKGIVHPKEAAEAVTRGVDGVIVSNHGGRQLNGMPASMS